jgi:hypothetical protein
MSISSCLEALHLIAPVVFSPQKAPLEPRQGKHALMMLKIDGTTDDAKRASNRHAQDMLTFFSHPSQ